jgi:hypothetical protein
LRERDGELRFADFAPAYKRKFGRRFVPSEHGQPSLELLCRGVEGVELAQVGVDRSIRLLVTRSGLPDAASQANPPPRLDLSELKSKLHGLLTRNPGVTYSELTACWRKEIGEDLNFQRYGITSFSEFQFQTSSVCNYKAGRFYPVFNTHMVEQLVRLSRDTLSRAHSHFDHGNVIAQVCKELGVKSFETLGLGRYGNLEVAIGASRVLPASLDLDRAQYNAVTRHARIMTVLLLPVESLTRNLHL